MRFIKDFMWNLGLLILLGVALYIFSPKIFSQVYWFLGKMFGPVLIILLIVVTALPRRHR